MELSYLGSSSRYSATLEYLQQVRTRCAQGKPEEYTPELAIVDELLVTLTESDSPAAIRDGSKSVAVPLVQQQSVGKKFALDRQVEEQQRNRNRLRFLEAYSSMGILAGIQGAGLATSSSALSPEILRSLGWSQIEAALPLLQSIPRLREIAMATGLQLAQAPLVALSMLATPLAYVRGAAILRSVHAGGAAEKRLELLEMVEGSRHLGVDPDLESISRVLGHKPAGMPEQSQELHQVLLSLQAQRQKEQQGCDGVYTSNLRNLDSLSSQLRRRSEQTMASLEKNVRGEIRRADWLANLLFLAAGAVSAGNLAATITLPGAGLVSTLVSQALAGLCGAGVAEFGARQEKSEAFQDQIRTLRNSPSWKREPAQKSGYETNIKLNGT